MSYTVDLANATYLPTGEKVYSGGPYGTWKTLQTGDRIRIDWKYAFGENSWTPGTYYAPAVGEPLNIEVYDSASGKMIVTVQTTVLP